MAQATVKPLRASWAMAVKQAGIDPAPRWPTCRRAIAKYGAGP